MTKFDEYIVAHIDILGTSEKIRNDINNKHFELLKSIYEETNFNIQIINGCNYESEESSLIEFKIFSDNILVFQKVVNDYTQEADAILNWIAFFQASALAKGILTRGGIAHGEFHYDENFVYGKALLEAVYLEENCAIYPRVIFSPDIKPCAFQFAQQDMDGLYFINYWHSLWFLLGIITAFSTKSKSIPPPDLCTKKRLLNIKQRLLPLYAKEVNGNIKILQKYQWLINQYNSYCKGLESGEIKEKLEKDMSFDGCYITKEDLETSKKINNFK